MSHIHDPQNCNGCLTPVKEVVTQMILSSRDCCVTVNNGLYPNKNVFNTPGCESNVEMDLK